MSDVKFDHIATPTDFWNQVQKVDVNGCWPWLGYCFKTGYGGFYTRVRGERLRLRAHRVAWILTHGEIPDGLFVCHHCDNKLCCRPGHLFLGTPADNTHDMITKDRQASGERQGSAKLTARKVQEIRSIYAAGGISQLKLGAVYGVSQMAICKIIRGKTWVRY